MKVSVEGRFQPTRIDKIGVINLSFLFECCRVQNARLPFVFFLLSKLKKILDCSDCVEFAKSWSSFS